MGIWDIVYLALVVLCAFVALISTIIAVRKRKATNKDDVQSAANENSFFEEFAYKAVELINNAENMFKKFGVNKAGELKLDNVLTKLRTYITDRGCTFDEEKWTSFIKDIVNTGNNIGHGSTVEEQSQSTGNEVVATKSNIDNVRI